MLTIIFFGASYYLVARILGQPGRSTGRHGVVVPGVCDALPAQLDGQAQRRHAQHAAVVVLARRAHVHVQRAQETQSTCVGGMFNLVFILFFYIYIKKKTWSPASK